MNVSNLKSQTSNFKILIRLPNWLGDVVMSTAFVNAVIQHYPGAVVDAVIKKELISIAGFIPGLNKVYPFSKQEYSRLRGVYNFGKVLRGEGYDLYFNLPHSLSAHVMAWASRAKCRIGFANISGVFLMTYAYKKPVNKHRVDEYVSLLEQFTGQQVINKKVRLYAEPISDAAKNSIIINFNSEAGSRRMPVDKGRGILKNLLKNFTATTFTLIGSSKEITYITEVLSGLPDTGRLINYSGKTDLPGLINLLAGAKAVLTTDSGPAHLANSVGAPVVAMFGAGNEQNTSPYNKEYLTVLRYGQLNCEPCLKNTCLLYGLPKCMEMLEEIKIINALSLYLTHA